MAQSQRVQQLQQELSQSHNRQSNLKKINSSLMDALSRPNEQVTRLTAQLDFAHAQHSREIEQLKARFGKVQVELEQRLGFLEEALYAKDQQIEGLKRVAELYKNQNERVLGEVQGLLGERENMRKLVESQEKMIQNTRKAVEEQVVIQRKIMEATLNQKALQLQQQFEQRCNNAQKENKQNISYLKATIKAMNSKLAYYEKEKQYRLMNTEAQNRTLFDRVQFRINLSQRKNPNFLETE